MTLLGYAYVKIDSRDRTSQDVPSLFRSKLGSKTSQFATSSGEMTQPEAILSRAKAIAWASRRKLRGQRPAAALAQNDNHPALAAAVGEQPQPAVDPVVARVGRPDLATEHGPVHFDFTLEPGLECHRLPQLVHQHEGISGTFAAPPGRGRLRLCCTSRPCESWTADRPLAAFTNR